MFIKNVITYDYNYAEYIVSDGENDVICMCLSVPLPNNQEPKQDMEISSIYAFSYKDINIQIISMNEKEMIQHTSYFGYKLRAKVFDASQALVIIGKLIISLENYFVDGFPKNITDGVYIQFDVDRLDCIIKI